MLRRSILTAALLATANCAPMPAPAADPPPPRTGVCDARRIADLIGKPVNDALVADAKRRSGAKVVRRILPGMMVTMDYSAARLNLYIDAKGRVAKITCG